MKHSIVRWSVLLMLGVGIGLCIKFYQAQKELDGGVIPVSADDQTSSATILKQPQSLSNSDVAGGADIGGAFDLIDQDGKAVTQDDYANAYKLVFFGFTHCPSICPTELKKITLVMNELGETANRITPIFITVDPARDTPEQIKSYLKDYHPKMVGLTGSQEQIDAVGMAYRVYAKKIEAEFMEGYMMDHSAFTYLMSPDNRLVAIFASTDTAQSIAENIKARGL